MKEQIHEFVCKTTFSNPEKINDDTQLFDEGIFDSMGLLNLIAFLEENFDIQVEDSELDASNFGSIKAIGLFLGKKLKIADSCVELPDL